MNLDKPPLTASLERALRRKSPASGFAGRVIERIEREEALRLGKASGLREGRAGWWRAAAASIAFALLLGGYTTHKVVEHRRGMEAREKVLEAMRIAGEKARIVRKEVREIGTQN